MPDHCHCLRCGRKLNEGEPVRFGEKDGTQGYTCVEDFCVATYPIKFIEWLYENDASLALTDFDGTTYPMDIDSAKERARKFAETLGGRD